MADCEVRSVAGCAFEDILDGYFPLEESVRQLMQRHDFASMWITLLHAPVMNIAGLPPTAPVPLYLPKIYSGIIDRMVLSVEENGNSLCLRGVGEWLWVDGTEDTSLFPTSTRLGEPAFVRGIGIRRSCEGMEASSASVALARLDASMPISEGLSRATAKLGWRACRAWGGQAVSGVHHVDGFDASGMLLGHEFQAQLPGSGTHEETVGISGGGDYVLVDLSPEQPDQEALELARLL